MLSIRMEQHSGIMSCHNELAFLHILNGLLNQAQGALTENHWVCLLERSWAEILQDHFALVYTVLVQGPPPTPIVQVSGFLGIKIEMGKKRLASVTALRQGKIKINYG